ncbi:M48 family metalloprotease [Blastomonas sp.]|uniref:M48 family metalloprotease n=1 Tax=Blastomonas sp. TaxID=1909299 RepID=UPI00391D9922
MIARICWTAFAALVGLAGATEASAQPVLPPPYSGSYQPQGVDEIGWWREMDEEESVLAQSDLVLRDEALNGYVRKVLCETVGQDRCNSVRIYIVRAPFFNASMTANGTMRVFTGLLLRVRNEAELGMVLGHEFGHFENRHILGQFKARRSGSDVLAWAAVLGSLAPSYDVVRTYRNLEFSIYGNLYRYGRDHEREADRLAIAYLNTSALRPQAASQMWESLMAEAEASARSRGLKKPKFDAIAFAASHPPDAERAGYLAELARADAASRDDGAVRYRAAIAPWLGMLLDDQIKLNDFGASEYLIDALAQGGWTAQLWHARGELYRMRGSPRDLVNAAQFYAQAVALDPALAEAHRGLGLSLLKTGQPGAGQTALRRYLELKPDASDARMMRMMIPEGLQP